MEIEYLCIFFRFQSLSNFSSLIILIKWKKVKLYNTKKIVASYLRNDAIVYAMAIANAFLSKSH